MEIAQYFSPVYELKCEYCDFETNSYLYLKNHIRFKHVREEEGIIYRCDICLQTFTFPDALKQHIRELHQENATLYSCNLCSLVSNSSRNIRRHVEYSHNRKEFFCKDCNSIVFDTQRQHLDKHRKKRGRNQKDPATLVFHCDKCDYKTDAEKYLKGHRVQKHSSHIVNCKFCRYSSPFETKLQIHELKEHSLVTCDQCDFQSNYKHQMKYHQQENHSFSCKPCDFSTKSKAHLSKHNNVIHNQPIKCDTCVTEGTLSYSVEEWLSHRQGHGLTLVSCTKCDFISTKKCDLSAHDNSSHKQKECQVCRKLFNNKIVLDSHVLHEHRNTLEKCENCEFYSSSFFDMKRHYKHIHFYCNKCKLQFKCFEDVDEHMKTNCEVKETRILTCKDCNKSFEGHPKQYYEHRKTHTVTHSCDQCDKSFASKKKLRRHKILHDKIYKCKDCSDKFSDWVKYEEHRKSHSKIVKTFYCKKCDFTANKRKILVKHILKEHKKTYECKDCSEKFSNKIAFEKHKKTHQEVKIFPCKKCNFIAKGKKKVLIDHMLTLHKKRKETSGEISEEYMEVEKYEVLEESNHGSIEEVSLEEEIAAYDEMINSLKVEAEVKTEAVDMKPLVKDELNENATYVCPLSSCTFMTNISTDLIRLEHCREYHPHVDTDNVKFLKL